MEMVAGSECRALVGAADRRWRRQWLIGLERIPAADMGWFAADKRTDAAGETTEKTLATQSSALGEGGCCSLSRPSDDLKIS